MPHEIIFRERYGQQETDFLYVKPPDQNKIVRINSVPITQWSLPDCTRGIFQKIFLPQGYPESVSDDYLDYQIWDTIQAFCSSITGTLATQSVMKGVGVGDTSATPLAATLTWIYKDGTGMVGRIFFAWWKGTYLDSDCKKWRLMADIINDSAMFLELIAPLTGQFTLIICMSTVLKSIVGVAGGATRAAVTQHQARRGNMADVSAKDGSQETLVNLSAMIASIFFLPLVSDNPLLIWCMFIVFTCLHLVCNYKAVKSLKMDTLNRGRFLLLLNTYLSTQAVPPPKLTNAQESVILGFGLDEMKLCGFHIQLGSSLKTVVDSGVIVAHDVQLLLNIYRGKPYLLIIDINQKIIIVLLHSTSTTQDQVEVYFHALILGIATTLVTQGVEELPYLNVGNVPVSPVSRLQQLVAEYDSLKSKKLRIPLEAVVAANIFATKEFSQFSSSLRKQGWNTDCHLLQTDEWRGEWDIQIQEKYREDQEFEI